MGDDRHKIESGAAQSEMEISSERELGYLIGAKLVFHEPLSRVLPVPGKIVLHAGV